MELHGTKRYTQEEIDDIIEEIGREQLRQSIGLDRRHKAAFGSIQEEFLT